MSRHQLTMKMERLFLTAHGRQIIVSLRDPASENAEQAVIACAT
jgi:hypothetical protein